jgi:SM-20-related protein
MEKDFEILIASFIEDKVGIAEQFLSEPLANHLKENLLGLHKQKLLLAAATGNANKLVHNAAVRSDSIYWLDRKHEDKYENEFFDLIEDFIKYLNSSCYAGITGYEFHYSLYETGSFYKKHLDQFKNNSGRKYSLISYLNNNWMEEDGGQLLIHHADKDQKISPMQGKTVFFKSNELEHEVLISNQSRMSIAGWLKSE